MKSEFFILAVVALTILGALFNMRNLYKVAAGKGGGGCKYKAPPKKKAGDVEGAYFREESGEKVAIVFISTGSDKGDV